MIVSFISWVCTIVVIGIFLSVILILLYATMWPVIDRIKLKLLKVRTDNLKGLVFILGKNFDEITINRITDEMASRVKVRTGNNLKKIRAITSSVGLNGVCYITVWFKSNTLSNAYIDMAYNNYNNGYNMNQFRL